ncbi:hypothetical protein FKM82_025008 [Ascaphus truei]
MVVGCGGFKFQNWAETYGSSPELYFQPTCVEEIKEILDLARQRSKRVKVVGAGHSPSNIACTDDFMIRMDKMNKIIKMDKEKMQVTVEAGILLTDLNEELTKCGLALSNSVSGCHPSAVLSKMNHLLYVNPGSKNWSEI